MAADFNKPITTDTYANVLAEIRDNITATALLQDPAYVTPTNTPTNTVRWNSAYDAGKGRFEKFNGVSWATLTATYSISISGSAGTLSTPRAIYGNNFDGSAALTQVIGSAYGGTGNGFAKFTGPTTVEKIFTLPDLSATLLYSGGALGTPASGVATNLSGTASGLTAGTASGLNATALAVANTWTGVQTFGSAGTPVIINSTNSAADKIQFKDNGIQTAQLYSNATYPFLIRNPSNATAIYIDGSSNFTAVGNVTAYSDERLKNNWSNLPTDFIARLAEVKHGTYDRTDIKQRQVGVSAQSLQELMPEAVLKGENGTLMVAYGNAALAACVELAKEIMRLRAKLGVD